MEPGLQNRRKNYFIARYLNFYYSFLQFNKYCLFLQNVDK